MQFSASSVALLAALVAVYVLFQLLSASASVDRIIYGVISHLNKNRKGRILPQPTQST